MLYCSSYLVIISLICSLALACSLSNPISTKNAIKSNLLQLEFQKPRDDAQVNEWIRDLESQQDSELSFPSLWSQLDGRWLLRYSNNAASLRQVRRDNSPLLGVQQVIDGSRIEHVLSFEEPVKAQVVLKHSARIQSRSRPAQLSLDLDGFELRLADSISIPSPPLLAPGILRRGYFEVCCKARLFT